MTTPHRVALLGFSSFERSTLASCFRLATRREPAYALEDDLAQAHFAVADADHPPTVLQVTQAGRVDDTVFIGKRPPPGATAWMLRPIDPLHVMRELDAMVALAQIDPRTPPAAGAAASPQVPAPSPSWVPTPLPGRNGTLPAHPVADSTAHPAAHPPAHPATRARPSSTPSQATPATQPAPATVPGPAARLHALLVDDSELALRFLASRLQPWGLQCTLAPSSTRALELMSQQPFDFVFLDVELGPASPLDGLELCRHLRRQHPQHGAASPLLAMVSAHHSELDRARGALAGADAYLGKPLLEPELARLLRRQGLKEPGAEPVPGPLSGPSPTSAPAPPPAPPAVSR